MDMFLAALLFSLNRANSMSHSCFCLAVADYELSFEKSI